MMKKIIMITSMLFALFCSSNLVAKPTILTTFETGSFSAGMFGCWGSNLCRKDVVVQGIRNHATEVINNLDGTISISFSLDKMNDKNKEYYRDRTVFENNEEFLLSDDECTGLKLKRGTKIIASKSEIIIEDNYMIVTLKVK
jgi:hypothetical protein